MSKKKASTKPEENATFETERKRVIDAYCEKAFSAEADAALAVKDDDDRRDPTSKRIYFAKKSCFPLREEALFSDEEEDDEEEESEKPEGTGKHDIKDTVRAYFEKRMPFDVTFAKYLGTAVNAYLRWLQRACGSYGDTHCGNIRVDYFSAANAAVLQFAKKAVQPTKSQLLQVFARALVLFIAMEAADPMDTHWMNDNEDHCCERALPEACRAIHEALHLFLAKYSSEDLGLNSSTAQGIPSAERVVLTMAIKTGAAIWKDCIQTDLEEEDHVIKALKNWPKNYDEICVEPKSPAAVVDDTVSATADDSKVGSKRAAAAQSSHAAANAKLFAAVFKAQKEKATPFTNADAGSESEWETDDEEEEGDDDEWETDEEGDEEDDDDDFGDDDGISSDEGADGEVMPNMSREQIEELLKSLRAKAQEVEDAKYKGGKAPSDKKKPKKK